jgi:molybdate transport system ATP-binding protein
VISDRVAALEPNGTLVRVRGAAGLAADITPVAAVELGLHTGAGVWFVLKAAEVAVYPMHGSRGAGAGNAENAREPVDH